MPKLLNIYLYGSNVYKTNSDKSDIDYIFIFDHQKESEHQSFSDNLNITSYPFSYFQSLVNDHRVSALECYFLPTELKIELLRPNFSLNREKLRRSFSEKSSNSWVKAKKKIEVHEEYYIGMKSLFHSLRILNFGTQIAKEGKIYSYSAANDYWKKIIKQNFKTWEPYKNYWKPEYNKLKTEFKKLCPF